MKRLTAVTAAFAVAASAGLALAQMGGGSDKPADKPAQRVMEKAEPTLKVGDPAPAMSVEKWIKGDPITGYEKGRVYVVEFWATWCPPCIRSMPHLSDIQREFRDRGLTVVGVTSADERGNTLEKTEKMVTDKGEKMAYTVAWDKGRETNEAFMKASGRNGIPCSFVVDQKGNIAFIGHPMQLDMVLGTVLDGKWDYANSPAEADKAFKKLIDEQRTIRRQAEEDPKAALKAMDEFDAKHPRFAFDPATRFQVQLEANDPGANKSAEKIVDTLIADKNAMALNEFAWNMVDPDGDIKNPPLDAALRAAEEAVRLTKEKDGAVLDTLARVWWLKGDKAKAIEIQERAVEHAADQYKEELVQRLKEYQADSKN